MPTSLVRCELQATSRISLITSIRKGTWNGSYKADSYRSASFAGAVLGNREGASQKDALFYFERVPAQQLQQPEEQNWNIFHFRPQEHNAISNIHKNVTI